MTKKPYLKAPRVSRSGGTRLPRQRRAVVRPPLSSHFALLDPGDDDHPVDLMVDRLPTIARRARRVRRLADQVQRQLGDDTLFLRHEDLRLEQETEREETYYNTGFEHGHLAGRATARYAAVSPMVRKFVGKLQNLLTTTDAPDLATAVVLLGYASALLVPFGRSAEGASTTRARKHSAQNKGRQP